jgi:hypothetical protein
MSPAAAETPFSISLPNFEIDVEEVGLAISYEFEILLGSEACRRHFRQEQLLSAHCS